MRHASVGRMKIPIPRYLWPDCEYEDRIWEVGFRTQNRAFTSVTHDGEELGFPYRGYAEKFIRDRMGRHF
jgi:hypothetical protein